MREILFRGKAFNGEWEYGVPVFSGLNNELAFMKQMHSYDHQVIPETVGQYTSLTDKNGKKIFEGDIHERENHFFVVKYGKYHDCETDEGGYGWYLEYSHKKACEGFSGDEDKYINIIGNIHDNPDLLKEGADNE